MSLTKRVLKFAAKSIGEQMFATVGVTVGTAIGDLIAKKINPSYREALPEEDATATDAVEPTAKR